MSGGCRERPDAAREKTPSFSLLGNGIMLSEVSIAGPDFGFVIFLPFHGDRSVVGIALLMAGSMMMVPPTVYSLAL